MRSAPQSNTPSFSPDPAAPTSFIICELERLLFLAHLHRKRASFTEDLGQARRYGRAEADSVCQQLVDSGTPSVVLTVEESNSVCILTVDESEFLRGIAGGNVA